MKKLTFALLALLCVALAATAFAAQERVFDQADLFADFEKEEINERIVRFQEATGMDFVVVTSDTEHDEVDQKEIAGEFYDRYGFGLDENRSGILYMIDLYERIHFLSNTGRMIDYMVNDRIDEAIEICTPALSEGAYAEAVLQMIDVVEEYVDEGIPEGQFRYDVVTGERLTAGHKALTRGEIVACALIAAVVAILFAVFVESRYKLRGSTYDYQYRDNATVKITDRDDTYLRTTTTQTRKPDPPRNSGSSGGGFGGGSGVYTTSGGGTHSGGGGRF